MALSTQDQQAVIENLVKTIYQAAGATANMNTADWQAALVRVEQFMSDYTVAQVTGAGYIDTAKSVLANLLAALPEPVKTAATNQQLGLLVAYWAMKKGGVI